MLKSAKNNFHAFFHHKAGDTGGKDWRGAMNPPTFLRSKKKKGNKEKKREFQGRNYEKAVTKAKTLLFQPF